MYAAVAQIKQGRAAAITPKFSRSRTQLPPIAIIDQVYDVAVGEQQALLAYQTDKQEQAFGIVDEAELAKVLAEIETTGAPLAKIEEFGQVVRDGPYSWKTIRHKLRTNIKADDKKKMVRVSPTSPMTRLLALMKSPFNPC